MAHSNPRNAVGKVPAGAPSPQRHWRRISVPTHFYKEKANFGKQSSVPASGDILIPQGWGIQQLVPVEYAPSALSCCLSNTEGSGSDSCLAS